MSYYEEREARRRGERDFDRCHWDHQRQYDHTAEGRAYRRGYEEAKARREEEQRDERRRWRLQQEQRELERQLQMSMEQQHFAQQQAEREQEQPEPEPDPMIEAIEQAVTAYQNNLADNVP